MQALPAVQIEGSPLSLRDGIVLSIAPLVLAGDPVTDGGLIHNAVINALQPVVIPLDGFVVDILGVEGALLVGRAAQGELLGALQLGEPVLSAQPVEVIVDGVLTGAGIDGDVDVGGTALAHLPGVGLVEGHQHGHEIVSLMLALLGQKVVEVLIHLVVGVSQSGFPELLHLGGQLGRAAALLVTHVQVVQMIHQGGQHSAGMHLTEHAVAPAGILGKDGLQVRGMLVGGHHLVGAEVGQAHHADVAVAPILLGHPLDQVVVIHVGGHGVAGIGLAGAAGLGGHMGIAAGTEELAVAGLNVAEPEMGPGGLGRHGFGKIAVQQVLVVQAEGQQRGEGALPLGNVDVNAQANAVAHGNIDILDGLHCGVQDGRIVLLEFFFAHGCGVCRSIRKQHIPPF